MSSDYIASKITDFREARNMSRRDLSEHSGLSLDTIRSIETGRTRGNGRRDITIDELEAIAHALVMNIGAFIKPDNTPGAPVVEVITVDAEHCQRCQGVYGQVETQTRADIGAISGLLTVQRGLAEQAFLMAARLDLCTDESKMATLNRELRITMEAIRESIAPKEKEGANGGGAKAADIFGDLGMPVITR